MINYPKPYKPENEKIKTEQKTEKKTNKTFIQVIKQIINPPPTKEAQLKKAYQEKYDAVYHEERKKHLLQKAETDAKKAATQDRSQLTSFLDKLFGVKR